MISRAELTEIARDFMGPDYSGAAITYNGVAAVGILRVDAAPEFNRSGSRISAELQILVADLASWALDDVVIITTESDPYAGLVWKVKRALDGSSPLKWRLHLESDRRVAP